MIFSTTHHHIYKEVQQMVTSKYIPQQRKLLALRARLRNDMLQMTNNAFNARSTRMPNHMAELGSDSFDQELTLNLLGSEQDSLDQIEAAIARIENGNYGLCETCNARIPKSRLQAIPYASQCVRCAEMAQDTSASDQYALYRIRPR